MGKDNNDTGTENTNSNSSQDVRGTKDIPVFPNARITAHYPVKANGESKMIPEPKEKKYKVKSAKEIYSYLDRKVSGQEEAKKALSIAAFLHQTRTLCSFVNKRKPMKKTNILLMGPSGCGKTLLVEKLAEHMKIGVFTINAKSLTTTGFKGSSIEDHLSSFAETKGKTVLETGIIFIDEFDKICTDLKTNSGDDWNTSLQHSLLKAIEGAEFNVLESMTKEKYTVNTSGIMFVLGGNFAKLRKNRKEVKKNGIGFVQKEEEKKDPKNTLHTELMKAGVTQEIAGRISVVAELKELTKDQMRQALFVEDGIYEQYEELLSFLDADLEINDEQINQVVERCLINGTGARGLQTALDELLHDTLFDLDIDSLTVEG